MENQKVLVTGSDGMIGAAVVQDLLAQGYQVTPVDKYPRRSWAAKIIDCEDLGQVVSLLRGHQAVIHLAAIPSPDRHPAEVVFRNNVISTYNVLEAAAILGIKKVVLASSISALGTVFGFRHFNPLRIPIDETHPLLAQDAYGLSKLVGEQLAEGFLRRIPELSLISLRFSLVVDQNNRDGYLRTHRERGDLGQALAGVFWTYVDVRDVATACRLALAYPAPGHEAFYINAPKIIPDEPVEALLAKYYPGDYPVAEDIRGDVSPVDCGKARRLLGWKAVYNWEGSLCD